MQYCLHLAIIYLTTKHSFCDIALGGGGGRGDLKIPLAFFSAHGKQGVYSLQQRTVEENIQFNYDKVFDSLNQTASLIP